MMEHNREGSTLSVHRAFVVHLGTGGGRRRRFFGRVEHLSSGRTAQFSSLAELLGFFTAVVARVPDEGARGQSGNDQVSKDARKGADNA